MRFPRVFRLFAVGLALVMLAACARSSQDGDGVFPISPTPRPPTPTHIIFFPGLDTATASPTQSPSPTAPEPTLTQALLDPSPTNQPTVTFLPPPSPFAQSCTPTLGTVEDHFWLGRPIGPGGRLAADRTYPYGSTLNGEYDVHHGLEFVNTTGTPIVAVADGVVVAAGSDIGIVYGPRLDFYGNLVAVEHTFEGLEEPLYSLYGHVSEVLVRVGEAVVRGQEIAKVGATGVALGSHLHFEIRLGLNSYFSTRNPILWLEPLSNGDGQQNGVIAGYIRDPEGRAVYVPQIAIEFLPEPGDFTQLFYYVEAYAGPSVNGDNQWGENFTAGELRPGRYRVSFVYSELFETVVEVQPGQVTLVGFCVP